MLSKNDDIKDAQRYHSTLFRSIFIPAALRTSKSVSMAHFLPGPGAYFSTAESIPDEQEDLNSDSEAKYMKQFIT